LKSFNDKLLSYSIFSNISLVPEPFSLKIILSFTISSNLVISVAIGLFAAHIPTNLSLEKR